MLQPMRGNKQEYSGTSTNGACGNGEPLKIGLKKKQQIPSPTQMNLHKRGIGTNGESGWLKPCVPGTPFLQVPL